MIQLGSPLNIKQHGSYQLNQWNPPFKTSVSAPAVRASSATGKGFLSTQEGDILRDLRYLLLMKIARGLNPQR